MNRLPIDFAQRSGRDCHWSIRSASLIGSTMVVAPVSWRFALVRNASSHVQK
jgi:hypothetical protein